MPEITETYYINAAAAVGKAVSGSDALHATTICVVETDDGKVHVGYGESREEALSDAQAIMELETDEPELAPAPAVEAPPAEAPPE